MSTHASMNAVKLGPEMLRFATSIDTLGTPDEVLNALNKVTLPSCSISVLVAALLPLRWGDWSGIEAGKTVFLHESAPDGWWDEWLELSKSYPAPGLGLARLSLAPFIKSEMMTTLEPLGVDRWPTELAFKHGIRDVLTCPVGGRWVVAYWSRTALGQRLSHEARAILFMGATFAAIRLQRLAAPQISRIGKRVALTPRELAVLRLLSFGHQIAECARLLGLGEETVRTHLKKAQAKLGALNRTHAVGQALRLQLIP